MQPLRTTEVWKKICAAAVAGGRDIQDIEVMAVSKGQTPERIASAIAAGYQLFGENRVQEAVQKFSPVRHQVTLHFIGNLQRNKVRKAVQFFDCIQSIDSLRLLDAVAEASVARPDPLALMLEIHTGEECKHGFVDTEEVVTAMNVISDAPFLQLEGLMTIAPHTADVAQLQSAFAKVRELRETGIQQGISIPHLSMGMSNDYALAIAQGATLLRLGRAVFGNRDA